MSEEPKTFNGAEVLTELSEQTRYAVDVLRMSREALFESKVGKDFDGKVPRSVIMHAVSRALTDVKSLIFDRDKFYRGVISLCLFYLEDEDVSLALKVREELKGHDKEDTDGDTVPQARDE